MCSKISVCFLFSIVWIVGVVDCRAVPTIGGPENKQDFNGTDKTGLEWNQNDNPLDDNLQIIETKQSNESTVVLHEQPSNLQIQNEMYSPTSESEQSGQGSRMTPNEGSVQFPQSTLPPQPENTNEGKDREDHHPVGVLLIREIIDHQKTPPETEIVSPSNSSWESVLNDLELFSGENSHAIQTKNEDEPQPLETIPDDDDEGEDESGEDAKSAQEEFVKIMEEIHNEHDIPRIFDDEELSAPTVDFQDGDVISKEIEMVVPTLSQNYELNGMKEVSQVFEGTRAFYFLVGPFILQNNSVSPAIQSMDPTVLSSPFVISLRGQGEGAKSSADIIQALAQNHAHSVYPLQK